MGPTEDDARDFLTKAEATGTPNGSSLSSVTPMASRDIAFFCTSAGRSASVAARARRGCEVDNRGILESSHRPPIPLVWSVGPLKSDSDDVVASQS